MTLKTIVAQATPQGNSGLAIIRVSGEAAFNIIDKFFVGKKKISEAESHTILYGNFISSGKIIDDITVSIFRAPNSYTGENIAEIGCHGGKIVPLEIIRELVSSGCTYASPGEFTRRAFINGKLDLLQVEAVADLIHSTSVPGAIASARQLHGEFTRRLDSFKNKLMEIAALLELELDFADEDIEFTNNNSIEKNLIDTKNLCKELASSYKSAAILREGFFVAIIGEPNAGKSTLFNALVGKNRAIVSDIPGTTRDYLEESLFLDNIPVKLIDTAGVRETKDEIEQAGIEHVVRKIEEANLIILLLDASKYSSRVELENIKMALENIKYKNPQAEILLVNNKCDLLPGNFEEITGNNSNTSAKTTNHNNFCICSEVASLIASTINTSDNSNSSNNIYSINISAKREIDINKLKNIIAKIAVDASDIGNSDVLLNDRQYQLLTRASELLENAITTLLNNIGNEFVSAEIRTVCEVLGEITGNTWKEDVLNNIFSRFCIGK